MLPVVAGAVETRRQILIYSAVLSPVGASPWLLGYATWAYGLVAAAAGALMIASAWRLYRAPAGAAADAAAKRIFGLSILYLFVLFAALLVERGVATFLARAFA
jgi:protoheme IX farnesyltransferase